MSDYYPKTIKQEDGSLIRVQVASCGVLGYFMESVGVWRLVWIYDSWRNKSLPVVLPFTVRSAGYAEGLIKQLNLIVAPSRITYVHGSTGTQPKQYTDPKECMPQMEQEYADWLFITPDAMPKRINRTRKVPEGWQAMEYDIVEIVPNAWETKLRVTVKYGFVRGIVGACSGLGKIELTHIPTGMGFASCQDYTEATRYADLLTELLPVGEWGIPPQGATMDKAREAMIALRASLSEVKQG
jgi:hypothetical protein